MGQGTGMAVAGMTTVSPLTSRIMVNPVAAQ
jgi:hypothetical protein